MPTRKTLKGQLIGEVRRRLESFGIPEMGTSICVALSGGPDSTALLLLLNELKPKMGLRLSAAHLNHGLRGAESNADQLFSKELATSYSIPFETARINLKRKIHAEGGNLEAIAREYRYQFLEEAAEKQGAQYIATGHTLDDQAETVLMDIIRGAGRRGLSGMPARRTLSRCGLIRPLLETERERLLSFLEAEKATYRLDSSNEDVRLMRNRVRRMIMPLLEDINPRIKHGLTSMARIIAEEDRFMEGLAQEAMEQICDKPAEETFEEDQEILWSVPYCDVSAITPALLRRVFRLLLEDFTGPDCQPGLFEPIQAMVEAIQGDTPQWDLNLPGGLTFSRRYKTLMLKRGELLSTKDDTAAEDDKPEELILPEEGTVLAARLGGMLQIERLPKPGNFQELIQSKDVIQRTTAYLDADKVKGALGIRIRRPGETIPVLGHGGHKKIKKMMMEAELSHEERRQPRLVVQGKNVLWVIGCTINNNYRVEPTTKNLLKIRFLKD